MAKASREGGGGGGEASQGLPLKLPFSHLSHLSAKEIGDRVRGLGPAYMDYAKGFEDNGMSGDLFSEFEEDELIQELTDMGIILTTKKIHNKAIIKCLKDSVLVSKLLISNIKFQCTVFYIGFFIE